MYSITFKKQNLLMEWPKLLKRNPKLISIALLFCKYVGGKMLVTEIYRTKKMQRAYYPKDAKEKSIHQYWRGVDISVKGIKEDILQGAVNKINLLFPYGKKKIKTALVHDIGLGRHLHLQSIDGGMA